MEGERHNEKERERGERERKTKRDRERGESERGGERCVKHCFELTFYNYFRRDQEWLYRNY